VTAYTFIHLNEQLEVCWILSRQLWEGCSLWNAHSRLCFEKLIWIISWSGIAFLKATWKKNEY
jgi:hypothetical protein